MKIHKAITVATIATLSLVAKADVTISDAFGSLYEMMGVTNVSRTAFLDDVADGSGDWYRHFSLARAEIPEQALREWFCIMSASDVPTNEAYFVKSVMLNEKAMAICQIGTNETAVCMDTNCWVAVARECGILRSSLHSESDLDAMLGAVSRHADTNGVLVVATSMDIFSDEFERLSKLAFETEQNDLLYKDFVFSVMPVFTHFLASGAIDMLADNERNSFVSNLVELARFTPDEAASLGLTNVVVNAGGE
jgi:hypothetical protein